MLISPVRCPEIQGGQLYIRNFEYDVWFPPRKRVPSKHRIKLPYAEVAPRTEHSDVFERSEKSSAEGVAHAGSAYCLLSYSGVPEQT